MDGGFVLDGDGGDADGGRPDAWRIDAGPPTPPPTGAFLESGGLVFVEVESAPRVSDWVEEMSNTGYTGRSYYRWNISAARTRNGGTGVLAYDINFTRTGRFQLHLRSAAPERTEGNDAFVRFVGASPRVVRRGSGGSRCPSGGAERDPQTDSDGWFKLYQNESHNTWTFRSHHWDHCAHEIFVDIPAPGTYRFEISGRSADYEIDRFALRHTDVPEAMATDPSQPESARAP